jgi:hypothetical protein
VPGFFGAYGKKTEPGRFEPSLWRQNFALLLRASQPGRSGRTEFHPPATPGGAWEWQKWGVRSTRHVCASGGGAPKADIALHPRQNGAQPTACTIHSGIARGSSRCHLGAGLPIWAPTHLGAGAPTLQQRIEKRLCRFQTGRGEAFGKAIVDRLEERQRVGGTALTLQ